MQRLQPVQGSSPVILNETKANSAPTPQPHTGSTIVSSNPKQKAFFATLLYPLTATGQFFARIASYVLNNFLPFCACCSEERMNWDSTMETFQEIKDAVVNEDRSEKDRVLNFNDGLKDLSPQAHNLFEQHIGFAIAKNLHHLEERAAQENWLNSNFQSINFYEDYFTSPIGNKILLQAVQSFWAEIQEKVKQS